MRIYHGANFEKRDRYIHMCEWGPCQGEFSSRTSRVVRHRYSVTRFQGVMLRKDHVDRHEQIHAGRAWVCRSMPDQPNKGHGSWDTKEELERHYAEDHPLVCPYCDESELHLLKSCVDSHPFV